MDIKLEPEMELIPPHNLMWNKDGTGAGDGVDTQKVQHKYGSRAMEMEVNCLWSKVRRRWELEPEMEWTPKAVQH